MEKRAKIIPLEACRGIAAIITLLHHFTVGFCPDFYETVANTVGYVFFNGRGAVVFFFVLSGFVLSHKYYTTPTDADFLKRSALKRWPRLMGPVLITTLASCLLFYCDAYFYSEAGKLSHSFWLTEFAVAKFPADFKPSFIDAFWQGFLLTFFLDESYYNNNLWTMRIELLGSLFVFAFAVELKTMRKSKIELLFIAMLAFFIMHYFLAFAVGMALSSFFAKRTITLKKHVALILLVLGLSCFSYFSQAPMQDHLTASKYQVALYSFGAGCIIFSIMGNLSLFAALNTQTGRYLGQLSFPIYLSHTLIILSAGSAAYLYFYAISTEMLAICAAFAVTLTITLAISALLALFDGWWVKSVNRLFLKIIPEKIVEK